MDVLNKVMKDMLKAFIASLTFGGLLYGFMFSVQHNEGSFAICFIILILILLQNMARLIP